MTLTLAERPPRRMPTLLTVHRHWVTDRRRVAEACGQADAGEPSCYACGCLDDQLYRHL